MTTCIVNPCATVKVFYPDSTATSALFMVYINKEAMNVLKEITFYQ